MSKVTPRQRRDGGSARNEGPTSTSRSDLIHRARQALGKHSQLRASAKGCSLELQDGVLVVRGCVPSFYLKQMLQTVLKDLEGVQQIDNQVEVIGVNGLGADGRSTGSPQRRHI